MSGRQVTVRASAKINLHLGVGAARSDGFHPLETVYQAVSLYDDLTARPGTGVTVTGEPHVAVADVPTDETNLAARAARALTDRPTALTIHKAVPVAGGMAGGSADAAAALVATDRLWDLGTTDDDLLAHAAGLGSDVPFSLVGGTALGTGRGEVVTAVDDRHTWWWVVAPATGGLSTAAVYRRFDELAELAELAEPTATPTPSGPLLDALASGDPHQLAATLHNDLQPAALDLRPDLGELLTRGEEAGALRGLVSGSGPTCVFLTGSPDHAREVSAALDGSLVAHGPVAGAHVVTYA
ncbi:4-(cytidine 5'-diphospho)-2-C-methyl-D-erythritol kinase [Nocardioides sp. SYSU D00038]|uniref:4-(cytidine 5'-diphospho)-2-C-methyl-D-erythritol kinase n=1 Tax=Nocardioides sp. SYSU D00038 TaxID=2812554 RepID=UPI00196775DD|nr:4-(cytidine 5'-diphospho)-2-C-methyl-D-erythritol kinase [Nocardioides sp. SYSU D00038]